MRFSGALDAMKAGSRVQRSCWVSTGLFLEILTVRSLERIYMNTGCCGMREYHLSQIDVLAEDWEIVNKESKDV